MRNSLEAVLSSLDFSSRRSTIHLLNSSSSRVAEAPREVASDVCSSGLTMTNYVRFPEKWPFITEEEWRT